MEELFNFPNNDFATGIPFLKPVFYDLTIIILRTPTFSINYIFRKNIIKMRALGTVQMPTEAFLAVLKLDE